MERALEKQQQRHCIIISKMYYCISNGREIPNIGIIHLPVLLLRCEGWNITAKIWVCRLPRALANHPVKLLYIRSGFSDCRGVASAPFSDHLHLRLYSYSSSAYIQRRPWNGPAPAMTFRWTTIYIYTHVHVPTVYTHTHTGHTHAHNTSPGALVSVCARKYYTSVQRSSMCSPPVARVHVIRIVSGRRPFSVFIDCVAEPRDFV